MQAIEELRQWHNMIAGGLPSLTTKLYLLSSSFVQPFFTVSLSYRALLYFLFPTPTFFFIPAKQPHPPPFFCFLFRSFLLLFDIKSHLHLLPSRRHLHWNIVSLSDVMSTTISWSFISSAPLYRYYRGNLLWITALHLLLRLITKLSSRYLTRSMSYTL